MTVDATYIEDLFARFGAVEVRRMFGGAGLFADGVMFALVASGVIYLKTDEAGIPAFDREGSKPFCYTARGKERVMRSYWRLPERLNDDPDELAEWAHRALAVARQPARRPLKRPRRKRRDAD